MLFRKKKKPNVKKNTLKKKKTNKKKYNFLIEDPSVKNEAHSRWEAEDIYDEDDFDNE